MGDFNPIHLALLKGTLLSRKMNFSTVQAFGLSIYVISLLLKKQNLDTHSTETLLKKFC
jgi:hypothetical protein